jgi:glutathione S-transferase
MTYFPHIDNVYSHRSTQRYKRKPFVSHYWDCRMKGRPPGTPKSEDPNKKKRKRNARERDLCDVKIKITQYLPSTGEPIDGPDSNFSAVAAAMQQNVYSSSPAAPQQFGVLAAPNIAHPNMAGQQYWTIQRVNGNGGNGKGGGVAGPHKHTLAKSDDIKKSTVERYRAARDREQKRAHVSASPCFHA